ncbi:deazaflavin-dependent oxidoreductase (nitroreductase family) [Prauserella shujinwangii]|uniref:Deazaflavin-dependent oxidoreductase (Nitroreductase family) n=1 Tax=Prauserella shujinwangii TaxID=1453103 RepID=A0A2T0M0M8_9PSEU|nr:nitroreductase/quinone reductase family protein [Prauserella shujinwangii]PRX50149.1 deazaflavin-dependent oxidoreductase (nitroreductase family) [Prauserella shujinwangii]
MPVDFNQHVIAEFRANKGRVGGPFEGARLLLLTTTGARSGAPHTVPLGYLPDGEGRTVVIGSAGGAPAHPAWFHNIRANPRVTVETGVFTFEADAVVLRGAERDQVFARAAEADSGWADYERKAGRRLPVVVLRPVSGVPNASAWGDALKLVHDAFRRELALIREEIARSGPGLGSQLRINCLTVCQGLHHHHASEDGQLLPFLDEHHPELAGTVARLRREHEAIALLLDELERVVSADGADPAAVLSEVDRLVAELEAHLDYEERLVPVLNAVQP